MRYAPYLGRPGIVQRSLLTRVLVRRCFLFDF